MLEKDIEIINKLGLHARAATKLANKANAFSSSITISYAGKDIDAKSIMSLMLLAAAKGSTIKITTSGSDEQLAMDEITSLVSDRFGEDE